MRHDAAHGVRSHPRILVSLKRTFSAWAADAPPGLSPAVDRAAREVLAATGVPSASIAVVKDGQIAYVQAYGDARREPKTAARPEMRYSIGSISKQFTATAVLMLAEDGKLSLDDPVARFLPTLSRANEVTVRQLLSHTSGYQDYWPQDYVPPRATSAPTRSSTAGRGVPSPNPALSGSTATRATSSRPDRRESEQTPPMRFLRPASPPERRALGRRQPAPEPDPPATSDLPRPSTAR
jgi:CubicO group peptidase (beta-lactamase class C family)